MNLVFVRKVVFNHANVASISADLHNSILLVISEPGLAILRLATTSLTVIIISIRLIFDFDVRAVPGDFAHDILNKIAVRLSA